jgi:GNAT superfamily N-acetyltransferase
MTGATISTQPFRIRPSTAADADAVTRLLTASCTDLLSGHYDPVLLADVLPIITMANPALLDSGTYYVAEAGHAGIIGCGGWSFERPGTRDIVEGLAHIRHFGTDPRWARRGVARAILSRCIEAAEAQGARGMECYSTLAAVGFYRSMGFVVAGLIDVPLKPGLELPSMLMKRSGFSQ